MSEDAELLIVSESGINLESQDQRIVDRIQTGRGCMKCTEKQLVPTFESLQGGEHIEMRGNVRCCNNRSVYSHHAIVDCVNSITNGGQEANVSLFGIPDTGGQIRSEERDLDLNIDKVRLVEYTMRKFDLPQTKERAKRVADQNLKVPYRLFTRNCENFSTICVVGTDNIDEKLSDSRTHQGRSFLMGVFNCVCVGSRAVASLISFFLYITFIAGDNIIDIVPKSSAAVFSSICKVNATTATGAKDHRICHLEIQSMFVGAYIIYLVIFIWRKCSDKFICKRCKIKSVITALSRFFLYCLLELLLIMIEPLVFSKIKSWILEKIHTRISLKQFVLVVIAFAKAMVECILIYWISNFFASMIPKYLVKKKFINPTENLEKGDVISWNRGVRHCSVDAIVTEVQAADDSGHVTLDLIYEESCSWTFCCTKVVKETGVTCDPKRMKVYDFSDFTHKFTAEDTVSNAEKKLKGDDVHCGFFCWNRSSDFCYNAKVKEISCPERFNSCEKCIRFICFY